MISQNGIKVHACLHYWQRKASSHGYIINEIWYWICFHGQLTNTVTQKMRKVAATENTDGRTPVLQLLMIRLNKSLNNLMCTMCTNDMRDKRKKVPYDKLD